MHTQLAVLGGGPGGYTAAFLAADQGLEATLIEQRPSLGGTCLLEGCIPSKALLNVVHRMSDVQQLGRDWGIAYGPAAIDPEKIRARKQKIIDMLSGGLKQLAKRRKVRLIQARGSLENSTTLRLTGDDPSVPDDGRLTFDHLILATGSRPAMPGSLAADSPRVMDSAAALQITEIPKTMLVIGGGYIGLELGSVYAHWGTQVTVVELTDGLLPGVDRDLVKPLAKRLAALFENRIHLNTKVLSLREQGESVLVELAGPDPSGSRNFDRVLVAVGRQPVSQNLGLENTQVWIDPRGFIECDAQQRSGEEHIFAIGDVAGEPMLAHKATHQAKVAIEAVLKKPARFQPAAIPAVVFTDPEIAWAGLTHEQAKQDGRNVEVALFPWAASGRALALGCTEGLTKWIVDPQTERILGCGIVGAGAGELIAEAVLAIEMDCQVGDLTGAIHPHPTLSETLASAAEVYLGTATEIYKPKFSRRRHGDENHV